MSGSMRIPWRESPWRDVISLAPDFIYGIAICWLYVGLAPRYGATFANALRATTLVFAVGAFTTYLGIANSGLLPWGVSAATTLFALAEIEHYLQAVQSRPAMIRARARDAELAAAQA